LKKHFMCSDLVSFIWDLNQENLLPQQIVEWFMYQSQGKAYFVILSDEIEMGQGEDIEKANEFKTNNNKPRRGIMGPTFKIKKGKPKYVKIWNNYKKIG